MKTNLKLVAVTVALFGSMSVAQVQAAGNNVVAGPSQSKYQLINGDLSQTIAPFGPEADPYLEHYRDTIGKYSLESATSQIVGPIGPEADPYLEHYQAAAIGRYEHKDLSQTIGPIGPEADQYLEHYQVSNNS